MASTWILKSKSAAELPHRLRTAALTANYKELIFPGGRSASRYRRDEAEAISR